MIELLDPLVELNGATIIFRTNENTDAYVLYRESGSRQTFSSTDIALNRHKNEHHIRLENLKSSTEYEIRIKVVDQSGNPNEISTDQMGNILFVNAFQDKSIE